MRKQKHMEGIYLLCSTNTDGQFVYKVGRSGDINRRVKDYPPNYEILLTVPCVKSKDVEKTIIIFFNTDQELGLLKYDNSNEFYKSLTNINDKLKLFIFETVNAENKLNFSMVDNRTVEIFNKPLENIFNVNTLSHNFNDNEHRIKAKEILIIFTVKFSVYDSLEIVKKWKPDSIEYNVIEGKPCVLIKKESYFEISVKKLIDKGVIIRETTTFMNNSDKFSHESKNLVVPILRNPVNKELDIRELYCKKKLYAVKKGREVGLFYDWETCKKSTNGFSGARYKSFTNKDDAILYLNQV